MERVVALLWHDSDALPSVPSLNHKTYSVNSTLYGNPSLMCPVLLSWRSSGHDIDIPKQEISWYYKEHFDTFVFLHYSIVFEQSRKFDIWWGCTRNDDQWVTVHPRSQHDYQGIYFLLFNRYNNLGMSYDYQVMTVTRSLVSVAA